MALGNVDTLSLSLHFLTCKMKIVILPHKVCHAKNENTERSQRQPALEKLGKGLQIKELQQSKSCYNTGVPRVLGCQQSTTSWQEGKEDLTK